MRARASHHQDQLCASGETVGDAMRGCGNLPQRTPARAAGVGCPAPGDLPARIRRMPAASIPLLAGVSGRGESAPRHVSPSLTTPAGADRALAGGFSRGVA